MRLRTIKYFWSEAVTSLSRNRVLSIATATTVSICVFILGIAVLLFLNTGEIMDKLESDVEIVAFLDNDLSTYQRDDLQVRLEKMPGVKSVTYVSKDQALRELGKSLGQGEYNLSDSLGGNNPLPDSFKIKAQDSRQVATLAAAIKKMEGISKIRYGQELVQKLFKVTGWVRVLSLFIVVFLAFAAVFLVATTIRLTIFSRRKEIYIMKLVGATDGFIRLPFFLEGMILALVGTAFAVLVLAFGYYYLMDNIKLAMAFIPLVSDGRMLINIFVGLAVVGTSLGLIGTFVSINKYLDV